MVNPRKYQDKCQTPRHTLELFLSPIVVVNPKSESLIICLCFRRGRLCVLVDRLAPSPLQKAFMLPRTHTINDTGPNENYSTL